MLDGETILRPTRRYTIHYRDGRQADVEAEAVWPTSTCLEFTVTVAVIGLPRQVVAKRVWLSEIDSVEREDGAAWRKRLPGDVPSSGSGRTG